jgi:hypothetical protein
MRVAIWATVSVIALLVTLSFVLSNPPPVGGGGLPYASYAPPGGDVLFWVGFSLVGVGIVLAIVRVPRKVWFIYVAASALPLLLSIWPASYDFWYAHDDSVHPWIGSDVGGHIAAGEFSLLIGLIFTMMLVNVSVVGYRRRRSKGLTNRSSQPLSG